MVVRLRIPASNRCRSTRMTRRNTVLLHFHGRVGGLAASSGDNRFLLLQLNMDATSPLFTPSPLDFDYVTAAVLSEFIS